MGFFFTRSTGIQRETTFVNPNISLGDTLLSTNSKVRAYWKFTNLNGDDWDVLTAHPDSSLNGTYNLVNNSGAFQPTLGFFNAGESVVGTLRARTSSGVNNGFMTSQVATALGNGEREYHFLFSLQDGVQTGSNKLAGMQANSLTSIIIMIDAGKISFTFALDHISTCTYLSDSAVLANNVTDIHLLKIRMTTTSIIMMLDGVNVPCSLSAGVSISTINLSSFTTTLAYGVGGVIGNAIATPTFRPDAGIPYKYIIKHAVSDLLTDTEYLQLSASFLNL